MLQRNKVVFFFVFLKEHEGLKGVERISSGIKQIKSEERHTATFIFLAPAFCHIGSLYFDLTIIAD